MINNSNFKIKEIPDFHPVAEMYEYDSWWAQAKKFCIEGMWSGGKWCPPELAYYINFHYIKRENKEKTTTSIDLPDLSDIEWEKAYIYTEACGFSGFEKDTKYTCHRWYGPEKDYALKYGKITEEELKKKIYVPAREYLQKIHNGNLGKPLYENTAKNVLDEEGRGGGKSMWASGCIAHNFLFDGARDYEQHLQRRINNNPYTSDTVVGAIQAVYSTDLLSKVATAFEYLPGKKLITNIYGEVEIYPSPLSTIVTGSLAPGKTLTSKTKSVINHRTFQDNPLAANGTRPNRVFLEEVGFLSNIAETWGALEATQAAAQHKRLVIYGLGTGGLTTGGAALYTQDIFYNPEKYNCLVFEDLWENRGKICYFVPAYKVRREFKEGPNLITNEEKAKMRINEEIEAAKKSGSSTRLLAQIINNPTKPSDIFLRAEGAFFPVADLKQALADLESNKILLQASYKADLIETSKNVIKIIPSDKQVITDYPMRRDSSMDAPIEIFEKPKLDNDGHVFDNRYIASLDPVDNDGNQDVTRSLQSAFILDTWTNRIVAEYTARTYLVEEYYENIRKLLIYYNAKILYENNWKGFYTYMKNKNSLHMLAETPESLKDIDLIKSSGVGNRSLGVSVSSDKFKFYAINLVLKWLEAPSYNNPDKKNLYTIRSLGLLKELISYSMDVNADRVSSLLILMIFREELDARIEQRKQNNIKTTAQSDFWGRAYGNFRKDKVHRKLKNLTNYDVN